MSEQLLPYCKELHALAQDQKNALQDGRLEDATALLQKREEIIAKVKKIDAELQQGQYVDTHNGKKFPLQENISSIVKETLTALSIIDNEMQGMIKAEMHSISEALHSVHKAKSSIGKNTAYHQSGQNLNVNT